MSSTTKQARLAVAGGAVAQALGVAMILLGFSRADVGPFHGLRFALLGAILFTLATAHLMTMWWVGRVKSLHSVYRMGYRHGRRDANAQLLEDGLWLADRAEGSASRNLPREQDYPA